jgi:hypothetical protein
VAAPLLIDFVTAGIAAVMPLSPTPRTKAHASPSNRRQT